MIEVISVVFAPALLKTTYNLEVPLKVEFDPVPEVRLIEATLKGPLEVKVMWVTELVEELTVD